jgi:AraC-like DNA-binding protein
VPVAARSVQAILEGLACLNLAPKRAQLKDDAALAALWRSVIARSGRRSIPLEVGLSMPLGAMGVVDYLAAASASIGAALTVAQQVFPLVAPDVQLVFETLSSGRRVVGIANQPPFDGQAESDLLVVGILLARVRLLAAQPLAPRVELVERGNDAAWKQLLDVDHVRLGARRTALIFTAREWSVPVRSADPRLLELLRSMLGPEQRSLDAHLVAIRALARERLPLLLSLDDAARALGVSRRTLQRRLKDARTSLRQLVDEARRDRALSLVDQGFLSLGEVATKVGFAEQASFTRAWTRWFGAVPSRRAAPAEGEGRLAGGMHARDERSQRRGSR